MFTYVQHLHEFQMNGCFVSAAIVVIVVYSNANKFAYLPFRRSPLFAWQFNDDETFSYVVLKPFEFVR